MSDQATEIDPEVLEDLRRVERCSTFFGGVVPRPEFWEAFTLLKTNRDLVQGELRRLAEERDAGRPPLVDGAVLEKLRNIRREHYPLAVKLREYLARRDPPLEGMRLELSIVFIMGSERGRTAATRWVNTPAGQQTDAILRLRVMSLLVDAYCKALLETRFSIPEPAPPPAPAAVTPEPGPGLPPAPPERAPEPPPAPAPPAPVPPAGVVMAPTPLPIQAVPAAASPAAGPVSPAPKPAPAPASRGTSRPTARILPQVLSDLRVVDRLREVLATLKPPVEVWEGLCLVMAQREETTAAVEDLERLRGGGRPGEYAGAAYVLRDKLRSLGSRHAILVSDLLAYLTKIFGSWRGPAEEMTVALIIASSQGRHRVKQWLEDPELCREDASRFVAGLRQRAQESLEPARR
jgi:hypothetical protein